MMKKLLPLLLIGIMSICLVACGSEKNTDSSPLSSEEVADLFANADKYAGRTVKEMPVLVSQMVGESDGVYQYQGYADKDYENTLIFTSPEDLKLKSDDYVLLSGTVSGTVDYETVIGVDASSPLIVNCTVEKSDASIFNKAIDTINVGTTTEQNGVSITLEKVELAENSTRVYLTVKNDSSDKLSLYTFNSYIRSGSKQFDESDISYEETTIQTDINEGIKSSGCLSFAKMDNLDTAFTVSIEVSSDDYSIDFEPFEFEVSK